MKRKAALQKQPSMSKKPRSQAIKIARIAISTEEKKNIDVEQINTLVAAQTTAVRKLLNPCAQGTTALTRAGRRTTMLSMEFRFAASFAATSAGASPVRLLIVYDRQPNGALAATTDIVVLDSLDSMMNLNNSRRFKVIVDELYSDGLSTGGPQCFYTKGFRDFTAKGTKKGLDCEFKDTSAGDITDILTGAFISLVWQNGNIITAAPTNALYTRIRFADP